MSEELNTLIEKYQSQFDSLTTGFNPCTTCCDMTEANVTEHLLAEFLNDLKSISQEAPE